MPNQVPLFLGGHKFLNKTIGIIVESAALNTVWMLTYLMLYLFQHEFSILLLHAYPSVSGIATTLVNVRVGLGWAAGEKGWPNESSNDSTLRDSHFNGAEAG
ncbi:hypothetical protein AN958_05912 [Leucoagaricus sp. SymC.cos]|nr:hypothetical protein AN958_05912 [Leucoagaricus sp. SymC.cos]